MRRVSRRQAARNRSAHLLVMAGGANFRSAIEGEDCAVCGRSLDEAWTQTGYGHRAHHAVSQQRLRKLGLARWLWHPGFAVCLCEEPCHRQETSAKRRVTRSELPARTFAVVVEILEETGIDLGIYLPQEERAA